MKKLRDEINEMLDVFDEYGMSEEMQLYVIKEGVKFGYYNEYDFDCFKFARLLKFCKMTNIKIDLGKMVYSGFEPEKYLDLASSFDKVDKMSNKKSKK